MSNRKKGMRKGTALRQNRQPMYRSMIQNGDVIQKRFTLPGTLSSTAGAIVGVTSFKASGVETSPATEWASFAARYQQYRVKSIHFIGDPCSNVNGFSNNEFNSQMYVGDYINASVPGSAAQVLSDERAIVVSTAKRINFLVTSSRNPNAMLWNPTSATLPAANDYSIVMASSTATGLLPLSSAIYVYVIEWIVEFRGSQ